MFPCLPRWFPLPRLQRYIASIHKPSGYSGIWQCSAQGWSSEYPSLGCLGVPNKYLGSSSNSGSLAWILWGCISQDVGWYHWVRTAASPAVGALEHMQGPSIFQGGPSFGRTASNGEVGPSWYQRITWLPWIIFWPGAGPSLRILGVAILWPSRCGLQWATPAHAIRRFQAREVSY